MGVEITTLGGGCFWCLEAIYDQLKGVKEVVSGYSGGHVPHPTYGNVCTGATGHAEVVQVIYDPQVISFKHILAIFFTIHDPTTFNRQGADIGSQYRSVIFYHSPEQKAIAREMMKEIENAGLWNAPLVTELKAFEVFYPAEVYHQNYFQQNPSQGYCRAVITPKVAKFRKQYLDMLKE
jgi:peptide-methionine (S)-S-oxide reductase